MKLSLHRFAIVGAIIFAISAAAIGSISLLRAEDAPPAESKEQRDARMEWWREARFGMFIHWGLYAKPAGVYRGNEIKGLGEWIMFDAKITVAEYETYAKDFNPVKFNADQWISLAKAAGMKYIVITAKHCDGFAMYPSKASKYNLADATPFKRDPMAELAKACEAQGIKLCFYYSHCWDWHEANATGFINDWDFGPREKRDPDEYFNNKALPQVEELAAAYKPAIFWFDVPDLTVEQSRAFLKVIRRHVPNCIVNDRVGNGLADYMTPEQEIPKNNPGRDWETCMTINDTWGFKTHDLNFKSTETLLRNLIDIAGKNGNYLLNIGPTAEGVIPEAELRCLKEMGAWMKVNGEAIYGTTGSPLKQIPEWGRITQKPGKLFLHVFTRPSDGKLTLSLVGEAKKAYLLATPEKTLGVSKGDGGLEIALPEKLSDPIATVVVVEIEGDVKPIEK
jgi:alpha-L-fucosidase